MDSLAKAADCLINWTRHLDRYPKLITFTYNKKEEFKTIIGGVVSIATYIVLILYAFLMTRIMFEKNDIANSTSLVVNDINILNWMTRISLLKFYGGFNSNISISKSY